MNVYSAATNANDDTHRMSLNERRRRTEWTTQLDPTRLIANVWTRANESETNHRPDKNRPKSSRERKRFSKKRKQRLIQVDPVSGLVTLFRTDKESKCGHWCRASTTIIIITITTTSSSNNHSRWSNKGDQDYKPVSRKRREDKKTQPKKPGLSFFKGKLSKLPTKRTDERKHRISTSDTELVPS